MFFFWTLPSGKWIKEIKDFYADSNLHDLAYCRSANATPENLKSG
jgi:hypothetical protein